MISPEPLGQGVSPAWAQRGVAAAMDPADSPACHAADTERAGAGTVGATEARLDAAEAPAHIRRLGELGTGFDHDAQGTFALSHEAAHSLARVVRVKGDQGGAEIMRALIAAVRAAPSVQVVEGWVVTNLLRADGAACGVRMMRATGSAPVTIAAPAVLIGGGGSGGLFAVTTNPARVRGEATGLATEALRGEGALLIKDNHIAAAGGIRPVLRAVKARASHMMRVPIVVDRLDQLAEVLEEGGADVVLLDNMDSDTLSQAVDMAKGHVVLEASGNMRLPRIAEVAATGVDYIAVGTLTYSAQVLDLGLDLGPDFLPVLSPAPARPDPAAGSRSPVRSDRSGR